MLPSGALSIGPVTVADAGRYRCIAENSEGMVQADAIITVKGTWEGAEVGGATNMYCCMVYLCAVVCTAWHICVL